MSWQPIAEFLLSLITNLSKQVRIPNPFKLGIVTFKWQSAGKWRFGEKITKDYESKHSDKFVYIFASVSELSFSFSGTPPIRHIEFRDDLNSIVDICNKDGFHDFFERRYESADCSHPSLYREYVMKASVTKTHGEVVTEKATNLQIVARRTDGRILRSSRLEATLLSCAFVYFVITLGFTISNALGHVPDRLWTAVGSVVFIANTFWLLRILFAKVGKERLVLLLLRKLWHS